MRIVIEPEKCCGAGQCVMAAPAVFDQGEADGIVVLLDATPPEEQRGAVEEAILLCPVGAIRLEAD
ncbi:ferredoxin [Paracraurococcus lichenis]|uniref:Ferredoxin n=1 Tax=Paracraurococcus lichenis TaxID=3064888 RepID=A0ABT9E8Z6_9PROT|nr:ferredoxin [Paracraurococcus sp. LOR1-02]MDO9712671.1 ferredoxin [Paracraurococcus sp. LOR1-02]